MVHSQSKSCAKGKSHLFATGLYELVLFALRSFCEGGSLPVGLACSKLGRRIYPDFFE